VSGNADNTKKLAFEVDGLTTGTTRVVTIPDKSGTLSMTSDTVVEADITLADNVTNNVTSTKHGFCPKAPADATKFLNGANPPAYTVPVGSFTAGTSCQQNPFAASTKTTTAHGLGAMPTLLVSYLECLTGELGYTAGDRVFVYGDGSSVGNAQVSADTTNVYVIANSGQIQVINKTTPAGLVAATAANWKVVAVPYKIN
jgi:hypothetical protein